MVRIFSVAAVFLAGAASPALAVNFIDSTVGYATTGTAHLYNGTSFSFYPLNFNKSKTYGAIAGSAFTGHYGAKVTGTLKAKFGFDASVSFTNTVDTALSGSLRTVAGGQTVAGSSFALFSDLSGSKTTSNIGKGQVDASLNAAAFAGATLHAKGCIVFCKEGDLVNVGVGVPQDLQILGYHSATNSVTFLNKTYNDQLPKKYEADGLPFSATLDAINVSGTTKGGNLNIFHTEQQFAGAYVDVAQALVQTFGLPKELISGSVLGFDYTTVSAKIGIGVNAIYDVSTLITDKYINYYFSSPVQIYDSATNKWSDSRDHVTLHDEQSLVLRTATPTTSLTILPEISSLATTTATLKIDVTAEDHEKLLQVSGYGLSAGPLYQHDDTVELGTLGQFTSSNHYFLHDSFLAPMELNFSGAAAALGGSDLSLEDTAGLLARMSRVTRLGDIAFVFVPEPSAAASDTIQGSIEKVTNYNTDGCNAQDLSQCIFDRTFAPLETQQRLTRDVTGAPTFSYAVDFETIDRLEALPEGAYGEQATPESMRALLDSLPPAGSGGYTLDPPISDNSTPFTANVPEPAEWSLLIAGFGLIGSTMRRRRIASGATARYGSPAL